MKLLIVGMNHQTAPLAVRELFAAEDPGPVLEKLVASEEIDEAVVVSTCNRVELIATTTQPDAAHHRMMQVFESELAAGPATAREIDLEEHLYFHRDREAVCHVFRVSSSLDSMVVGEPQILGQMKDAYRAAAERGTCGPILSRLFQRAFATAKRVKNETRVAERPVSVARVAVDLAGQIFEDLGDKRALLVGAGEMMEAAMSALRGAGLTRISVANRTRAHAHELAERYGGTAHGLEDLDRLLAAVDVVLVCVGGDGVVLDRGRVAAALRERSRRPIFVIDIGVPRNVASDVNELESAYLYDLDDLQQVAATNARERGRESVHAERIVQEEQQRFDGWLTALRAVPTIRHLRARAEALRAGETLRALGRLDLDDAQREAVERLTQSIVNKILHAPLARLRSEEDSEETLILLEAARSLFALDQLEPDAPEDGEGEA